MLDTDFWWIDHSFRSKFFGVKRLETDGVRGKERRYGKRSDWKKEEGGNNFKRDTAGDP